MIDILPDCMMPDGAYPCVGYHQVYNENKKLKAQLKVAMEALTELQTACTHDDDDKNYRSLGDSYGWCSACGTKVCYKENIGLDALKKIQEIGK